MNLLPLLNFIKKCLPFIYLAFFLSVFCGFRVMSSTTESVLLGLTLVLLILNKGKYNRKKFTNYFVIGCLVFYILQLIGLTYTNNLSYGIRQVEVKITLIFIPITFYFNNYLNGRFRDKIMPYYVLIMALSMLYCFCVAALKYPLHHDSSVFFYHALVEPFGHHAIMFSIYTFVGFVYLLERLRKHSYIISKPFQLFILFYYIFFIVLLASKMVIIFTFLSILLYIVLSVKKHGSFKVNLIISAIASVLILTIIFITDNPVSYRFKDLSRGTNVIENNQFNPGDYFNGIQFRLLQWKLVTEILNEHNAWILGVSPGDAQNLLDKKYESLNMYVGDRNAKSHGYLSYNTHNEFLEASLQNGIVGLIVFLIICAGCIRMMVVSNSIEFWLVGTLLLTYCFLESVLQTQYGVLLFTFFPLFLFYTSDNVPVRESSAPHP